MNIKKLKRIAIKIVELEKKNQKGEDTSSQIEFLIRPLKFKEIMFIDEYIIEKNLLKK